MTEAATLNPPLAETPGHETQAGPLSAYDELTNPAALESFGERIADEASRFDYDGETAAIDTAATSITEQLRGLNHDLSINETEREQRIGSLTGELSGLGTRRNSARQLRSFMDERQYQWERRGGLTFQSHELEIDGLLGELASHAATSERDFVEDADFGRIIDETKPAIRIETSEEPLEFPLSAVVSAMGLKSWQEGRGENLKDGRSSRETIEDYAGRDTEIPPLDDAAAVILPDGQVIIRSDSAHRAAAAKLKGQPTIQINNLTVYRAAEML